MQANKWKAFALPKQMEAAQTPLCYDLMGSDVCMRVCPVVQVHVHVNIMSHAVLLVGNDEVLHIITLDLTAAGKLRDGKDIEDIKMMLVVCVLFNCNHVMNIQLERTFYTFCILALGDLSRVRYAETPDSSYRYSSLLTKR